MADFEHLRIEREPLANDRRTRQFNIPKVARGDLREHGQRLIQEAARSLDLARQQQNSIPTRFVFKIRYSGMLDIAHLHRHGVEFISQEDRQICVVFANEAGLAIFVEHLQRLGLDNVELSYKQILEAIDGIDNWTREDRQSWALRKSGLPHAENFLLDVELWPVRVTYHPERNKLCTAFEQWLAARNIRRIDKVNLDSLLMYRLEVNIALAEELLNHTDVRLVDLVPTSGISYSQLNRDIADLPDTIPNPPVNASKICILDSGIAGNHPLLAPAIAETVSFVPSEDAADFNGHGTAVSSVALYGDLEGCARSNYWRPELWLLSGKVLDQNAEFDTQSIENTLVEAVRYFVDTYSCKIFNISLGNTNSPYDHKHIRGIAYVLDQLSRELDVLFVVSAGNFSGSIDPEVPRQSWRDEYPEYLLANESLIIDPAPAMNVITVGSLAKHNATFDAQRYPEIAQLAPASEHQPSPFTRHGPSVKGAIKPELVAIGGNLATSVRRDQLTPVTKGMGVLTCNSGFVGGTLFGETSGTSFAAPYITHLAGRLLNNYPTASANLLRAMLVNNSNLPAEVERSFSSDLHLAYKSINKRDPARDVAGYGLVDESELFRSSQNVVTLIVEDKIANNEHHFYELPLPPEFLRTQRAAREIRVTLAYCPAVRTTRIDYLATKMHFRLVKDTSLESVQRYFNHDTQGETETRNDDATTNRDITAELRGRGTVQSSTWRMKQRSPDEKWFVVVTRQDRDWGEAMSLALENYALVVTVTDRENEHAELYTQIVQRIELRGRARL
jgi:hypothetical protein